MAVAVRQIAGVDTALIGRTAPRSAMEELNDDSELRWPPGRCAEAAEGITGILDELTPRGNPLPRVQVIPFGFATAAASPPGQPTAITVSTRLLEILEPDEVKEVVARELGHLVTAVHHAHDPQTLTAADGKMAADAERVARQFGFTASEAATQRVAAKAQGEQGLRGKPVEHVANRSAAALD